MAWSPPESDTIVAPAAKGRNAARAWFPPADDLIVTARSRPVLDAYQAQLAETGLVDPMTESFESWQARRPASEHEHFLTGEFLPLSRWDLIKHKLLDVFPGARKGYLEGAEPSAGEVMSELPMLLPMAMPEKLAVPLFTYFTAKTVAAQPEIAEQVYHEIKRKDYSAAQREAIEDVLQLGIIGGGALAGGGAKPEIRMAKSEPGFTPPATDEIVKPAGQPATTTEVSNASQEPKTASVSELEVRARVGETPPLRQPGETPETRPARAETPQSSAEVKAVPSPQPTSLRQEATARQAVTGRETAAAYAVDEPAKSHVLAAVYTNPDTGEMTMGASHEEAAAKQGVRVPADPSAREGRGYDFLVYDDQLMQPILASRQAAMVTARAAGQLAGPEPGDLLHSSMLRKPGEVSSQEKVVGSENLKPWQQTRAQYLEDFAKGYMGGVYPNETYRQDAIETNRDVVARAVAAGKAVPAEVLKDYPDLKTPPASGQGPPAKTPPGATGSELAAPAATETAKSAKFTPAAGDVIVKEAPAKAATPVAAASKVGKHLKLVGLGAAVPSEFAQTSMTPTGIRNAVVDIERAKRGLPPAMQPARRAFGLVWDEAMARLDQDPAATEELLAELREQPRALSDVEDALLLQRQISLQNQYGKMTRELAQAYDDAKVFPERAADAEEIKLHVAKLSDDLLDLYNIGKEAGTETARGLSARRMMATEDYSLVQMELSKRAANEGNGLTDAQRDEVQKLHDKIAATQKAFDDYRAKAEAEQAGREASETVTALNQKVESETRNRGKGKVQAGAMLDEQGIVAGLKQARAEHRPLEELGDYIRKLAEAFIRQGIRERDPLIDAVHGVLTRQIDLAITRRETMDAISGYGDYKPLNPDAIKTRLRDLKGQMQQVAKLEDLEGKRPLQKTGLERRAPSDEERRLIKQVNEAKRKYGVVTTDPARQLKSALEAIKTRFRNQIADLQYQISTRQRILKTKTPTPRDAESEKLQADRDLLLRQFNEIFPKPGLSDAQRVQTAMRMVQSQIDLYEKRLAARDVSPLQEAAKTPLAPELEALRARRDALSAEFAELRDVLDPGRQERAGLSALKTRLANSTALYQERLARGDFAPRVSRPLKLDAEATRLKVENERAKLSFQRGLVADRLNNRRWYEKAADTFVKWRRGFLLSSPVTLAKLTSAAVQRMVFTPLEEGLGYGWSQALPSLAARAPREGGFNSRAEARALTDAVTKGMKDSWEQLARGEGVLDVIYGKGRDTGVGEWQLLPRSLIDFFGHLHGALKAPVKRAEFARSFEKRTAWNLRQGVDVSDPLVQSRIALEAYKDGQRSIFLQDNRVVSAYQRALTAFEEKAKATGRVPLTGKLAASAARTLLPIVRVPTNIVAETFQYAGGLASGSSRLGLAMRRGIETLPPEEADLIMRHLKKGTIGAAFLLAGYLLPDVFGGYYQSGKKREAKDVKYGSARLFGVDVPSFLLHNPLLETLQLGATVRRVADSKLRKRDAAPQGIGPGLVAGALGLTEEVPFVREMLETGKAFEAGSRRAFFGELAKSIAVPQLLQWLAAATDKTSAGQPVQRQADTIMQRIAAGIPGLREGLREKISPDVATVAGYILRSVSGGTAVQREQAHTLLERRLQQQVDTGKDYTRMALAVKIEDLRTEDAVSAWEAADEKNKLQFAEALMDKVQRAFDGGKLDAATTGRLVRTILPYYRKAQAAKRAPAPAGNSLQSAAFAR